MVKIGTQNRPSMREISIFGILCEINPKNRKIIFGLPKVQSPKVIVDQLLRKACQDESNDEKIAKIRTYMWKL
jgi:hypothetical protein